ncbi:MAG: hypothetical protein C3F18_09840 [Nitrosomonadales bacterium]|nr:MAG: hypothetical protein C3F18_09840 [Nitrosomonadales bacterium]
MSKSAFSLRVFSIYMFSLGSVLVTAPNLMLSFFGIPETHEVWIRVVGVLVLIIGYLDFMASRNELLVFFRWSVPARLSVPVFFITFVTLGFAPPVLVLFGAIDAAAAIWTAICLRADGLAQPGAPADAAR